MEAAAELEQLALRQQQRTRHNAERSGETIIDLAIDDHQTGLGGRYLFTFVKRNRTLNLPWNRLRVGAPVVITPLDDDEEEPQSGVVSARNVNSIQVAVDT